MTNQKDIFDKIVLWQIFRWFEPFYKKHKEILLYLFFGGLTFLISVFSFVAFNLCMRMNELIANILSWIIAVLFAFFTNRMWVFHFATKTIEEFFRLMISFFAGRAATLILEEVILYVFISKLCFASILVKVVAQIMVIILNYVVSKIFVFKEIE